MSKSKKKLRIIPLGGLGEIGKNITVFEYGENIIVVDCGIAFPENEMLGVDLVIPDITYLIKNKDKIKGVILTHGHEDHIGAIPYILKQINIPVYGTRLTLGLLKNKLEEHGIVECTTLKTIKPTDEIKLGVFSIEFIRSTHSIADCVALAIRSPVGVVVHTSDFKIDYTPIEEEPMDIARLGELGREGVLLLMCDSTNIERKGYTMSESTVGDSFEDIFVNAQGRILVASFASNIHRIQQVINAAVKYNRKVAVCGRSMDNVINVALELGYMTVPKGTIIDVDQINKYPPERLVILTTGTQGEPMSALSRISSSDHKKVEINPGDLVVISATPIPGNEKLVFRVINDLFKKGAKVIYEELADIHVSGHACQEELKLIHSIIKPKYFMPIHGEYRHLRQHSLMAQKLGMTANNIFVMDIGNVLEINQDNARIHGSVPSGYLLVDGLGVGDVGNIVLRDRKHLSEDGLIIVVVAMAKESSQVVSGPEIISRGFVYVRESEYLIEELREKAKSAMQKLEKKGKYDWNSIKSAIRDDLKNYIYKKTKRKPMILPIIIEI